MPMPNAWLSLLQPCAAGADAAAACMSSAAATAAAAAAAEHGCMLYILQLNHSSSILVSHTELS